MKKRLMVGLMAGGLMAAMLPGVASANGPLGECPAGFVGPEVDGPNPPGGGGRDDTVGAPADTNGDGYWCRKRILGVTIYTQNNVPLS